MYIGKTKLTEMKHFMTLMALVVAVTAGAQGTSIHEYPWNPDFNNDTYIGSEDLMGLLSTYGTQFGLPPEPCDYDGTEFEEFFLALVDGIAVMDSIWVEYELEDINSYFVPGCPEMVTDTIVLVNYGMLVQSGGTCNFGAATIWSFKGPDAFGQYLSLQLHFNPQSGEFWFLTHSPLMNQFVNDGYFGYACATTSKEMLPWPTDWYLDEEGIHIESGWEEDDWPYYANYLHILPYWHYAE